MASNATPGRAVQMRKHCARPRRARACCGQSSRDMLLDVAALDARMVLELAARCTKRVGECLVDVLVSRITFGFARHRDFATGHGEINPDVELIAMAMVLVGHLHGHHAPL